MRFWVYYLAVDKITGTLLGTCTSKKCPGYFVHREITQSRLYRFKFQRLLQTFGENDTLTATLRPIINCTTYEGVILESDWHLTL